MDEGEGKSSNEVELAERVGTLVNERYRVLRLIGSGSTGAVYACQHVGLDKLVALKVLHREMEQNTSFVERFKLEAKAASRLEHPNSVRVLDFGQDSASGALYIAMEYIEGRDLLQVLEEDGPFSAERAVDVMSQILDVLGVAHGLSIVHRDLKPENILLRAVEVDGVQREHVTVCDFGIAQFGARRTTTSPDHSATSASPDGEEGLVAGTPAYMSPEQARAEPQDARSDLYSAGVVLYQLLTLQLPFYADDAYALALKHCVEVPPPPSRFGAVNPQLEDICLKALSKSRDARYQNAREMRLALQRVLMSPELKRARANSSHVTIKPRRWKLPRQMAPQGTPSDAPAVEMLRDTNQPARRLGRVTRWSLLGVAAVAVVWLATALLGHNQDQRASADAYRSVDRAGIVRPAPISQAASQPARALASPSRSSVAGAAGVAVAQTAQAGRNETASAAPQNTNTGAEVPEAQASLPGGPLASADGSNVNVDAEELLGESGERRTPSAAGSSAGKLQRVRSQAAEPQVATRTDRRGHDVKESARALPLLQLAAKDNAKDAGVPNPREKTVVAVSVAEPASAAQSAADATRIYRPDTRPDSHLELGLLPDTAMDGESSAPVAAVQPSAAAQTATQTATKAKANRESHAEPAHDSAAELLAAAARTKVPTPSAPADEAADAPAPERPAFASKAAGAARVSITHIASRSGVSKSSVRGALNLDAITDCYRTAVRGGGMSDRGVTGELELATSQSGSVTEASLNAPELPVPVRHCVEQIVRRGRVREADTGNAQATITLAFLPN